MAILFAKSSIRIVHGTAWTGSLIIIDRDTLLPVDLTGVVRAVLRVREEYNSPTILLQASTIGGTLTVPAPLTGEVEFHIPSALTQTLPTADYDVASYVYDIVIERSIGEYEAGASGLLTVFPQVTRLADTP